MKQLDRRYEDKQPDAFPTAFETVVSGMRTTRYNARLESADLDADFVVDRSVSRTRNVVSPELDQAEGELKRVWGPTPPGWDQVADQPRRLAWTVPQRTPSKKMKLLQQFEGTVLSVGKDEFVAVLTDLTDTDRPEEEATFDIEEVSPGDRELVKPGGKFRWNMGYTTDLEGQRERISSIRFLRVPGWRTSIIEAIERDAEAMMRTFSSSESDNEEPA